MISGPTIWGPYLKPAFRHAKLPRVQRFSYGHPVWYLIVRIQNLGPILGDHRIYFGMSLKPSEEVMTICS